jgi:hypothetical protein
MFSDTTITSASDDASSDESAARPVPPIFCLSFFDSVDVFPQVSYADAIFHWPSVLRHFRNFAKTEYTSKKAAPLFSATRFNGTRAKSHTTNAGLVVMDIDDGSTVDNVIELLRSERIEALIYTTASSRSPDAEKFRILVPLREIIDANTVVKPTGDTAYTIVWHAINGMLGGIADRSKRGAESLFYFPGMYPNATNRFEHVEGDMLDALTWVDRYNPVLEQAAPTVQVDFSALRSVDDVGMLYKSPFVRENFIQDYLSLPKGQHYRGLYRFMCRVGMSAIAQGYDITAG